MAQALTDLRVAGALALRTIGRRLRGDISPPPDQAAFKRAMETALSQMPEGRVKTYRWLDLPATTPPWVEVAMPIAAGDDVSWLACGRVYAAKALDIWVPPHTQLWAKFGEGGQVFSSSRNSFTFSADQPGTLYFGNFFPNSWAKPTGERKLDDSVYKDTSGGTSILVIHWAGPALEGLLSLARVGDYEGVVAGEVERLQSGVRPPDQWRYLWHIGEAEIYAPCSAPDGDPAICCHTVGDVGILQKETPFDLTPDTELSWRWIVNRLPGVTREDSMPSHDYLSIAVEFDNGRDITYYWSKTLKEGTGYDCPLPTWQGVEYHVVVRSGEKGLGEWQAESRNLYEDYKHYMGDPPAKIVRVWLIAVSLFQHGEGDCAYANIILKNGAGELRVA